MTRQPPYLPHEHVNCSWLTIHYYYFLTFFLKSKQKFKNVRTEDHERFTFSRSSIWKNKKKIRNQRFPLQHNAFLRSTSLFFLDLLCICVLLSSSKEFPIDNSIFRQRWSSHCGSGSCGDVGIRNRTSKRTREMRRTHTYSHNRSWAWWNFLEEVL